MCRLALVPQGITDQKFLSELFNDLEKSMGGDGNSISGFVGGTPTTLKGVELKIKDIIPKYMETIWDNGILFHTRMASVGNITDDNCHGYIWGNTITIHNGSIVGVGILKLMMLENINKYKEWSVEKIMGTTDSDILSYFIWKKGFDVVAMIDAGTVMTMYPESIEIYVGSYGLQAILKDGMWIYASEFSDTMGLNADAWVVFAKQSRLSIQNNTCAVLNGYCIDGVALHKEKSRGN